MKYNRCGRSGILLPAISLGLWHNFGSVDVFSNAEAIIKTAFDKGITHLILQIIMVLYPDAEENFGKIVSRNFNGFLRDQLFISTKAGYTMWDGPYGDWGSKNILYPVWTRALSV